MNKISKRNVYEALISLANGGDLAFETPEGAAAVSYEALAAFAENEIALLDKKSAKAKERAAEKRAEGDELTAAVKAVLSADEFEPIADIAARIEGEGVTAAKVTYRLNQLVKNGEAEKQELTIPGVDGGKSRKVQGFKAC